jgi:hypothetical protein
VDHIIFRTRFAFKVIPTITEVNFSGSAAGSDLWECDQRNWLSGNACGHAYSIRLCSLMLSLAWYWYLFLTQPFKEVREGSNSLFLS